MADAFTDYDAARLPGAVVAYLDARDAQRYDEAAAVFAADAVVLDEGRTHEGRAAIAEWIAQSSTEWSYTSTRLGQQLVDERHVNVLVRIDGNFPGGTATLRYRFELDGGLVRHLAIGS